MTNNIPEIVHLITSQVVGAQLCLVDLHIHTPASYDYQNKSISAKDIVKKAIEKKLKLIAITDHNCIELYDQIRDTAKDFGLVVLPGVEITSRGGKEGIHLIAIFPETTPSDLIEQKILCQIGMTKPDIRQKGLTTLQRSKGNKEKQFTEKEILKNGKGSHLPLFPNLLSLFPRLFRKLIKKAEEKT